MAAKPEPIPPELFLSGYPAGIQDLAERLRAVVHEAVPEAVERVRAGWRLIGYDVPVGRRTRYFAFVAPEPAHVHLGFEYGAWMADPDGLAARRASRPAQGPVRHLPAGGLDPGGGPGAIHPRSCRAGVGAGRVPLARAWMIRPGAPAGRRAIRTVEGEGR